jgi:hypothetical protein
MDGSRFDDLVKSLGAGRSRRSVLGALAGAVLAAVGVGQAEAATRKRSVGNSCSTNSDCASNLCVQETRTRKICHCASPADCPAATAQCQTAACLPSGYCATAITSGAACSDGNRCTTGDACQSDGSCLGTPVVCAATNECWTAGTCQAADGQCSPETYHGEGATCSAGVCHDGACCAPESQATTCDGGLCGAQTNNCGQTVQCLTLGGGSCQADTECCSGACVGNLCQAGKVATGGTCDSNADCVTGHCCSGVCRDFKTDVTNCGFCNNVCSSNNMATVTCSGGACNGTCAAGYADCDATKLTNGCETNILTDHDNCGGCGVVCSGVGETCQNGSCFCTANADSVTCAGKTCGSAVNNCGQTVSCGTCGGGETCNQSGQCVSPTCASLSQPCALNSDCCAGFFCGGDGVNHFCEACYGAGEPCGLDGDYLCCSGICNLVCQAAG